MQLQRRLGISSQRRRRARHQSKASPQKCPPSPFSPIPASDKTPMCEVRSEETPKGKAPVTAEFTLYCFVFVYGAVARREHVARSDGHRHGMLNDRVGDGRWAMGELSVAMQANAGRMQGQREPASPPPLIALSHRSSSTPHPKPSWPRNRSQL